MDEDVQLRDVVEADLPILFEHQRDVGAARKVVFKSRKWSAFHAHWAGILADPSVTKKTIVVDGAVAGHVAAFDRDGRREIGYWLGRSYWGRGIATRALEAFLLLEPRRPLYALVARHNGASLRVLDKCGFARVGEDPDFAPEVGPGIPGVVFRLG